MTTEVYRDSAVRWRGVFTVEDVDTDPTAVSLYVKEPDGTETTYTYANATVSKEATGIYYKDVVLDSEGVWRARMVGTGTCRAADIENVRAVRDPFS